MRKAIPCLLLLLLLLACAPALAETYVFDQLYATMEQVLQALARPYIKGFSLLGGEPLHPRNQSAVLELVKLVRARFPDKDIWCYTGYLYEDLLAGRVGEYGRTLLEQLDVLVDGPFVEAEKDLSLRFRGSANQRLIDVPASLREGQAVLWPEME